MIVSYTSIVARAGLLAVFLALGPIAKAGSADSPGTGAAAPVHRQQAHPPGVAQATIACFYRREKISGFNKICFYDCLGSLAAVTFPSFALCPLLLDRATAVR